jgi:hypothetical protein
MADNQKQQKHGSPPNTGDSLVDQNLTGKRAPYAKPLLVDLGDVRDITLGGSPGLGDSGAGLTEQP